MAFSPANSNLFAPLFSDPDIAEVFSDEQFVRNMVEVELALAKVQGELHVIPVEASQTIGRIGASLQLDHIRLKEGLEQVGAPVVALVNQLREGIGGEAANFVHWGATTQDIVDTAVVLQIRASLRVLENNLLQLIGGLSELAEGNRDRLMAGRTHSQQALPIPFGFKVASWLAPLVRHRQRLNDLKPRILVLQFGGAVGTLAALGQYGIATQEALASELGLNVPLMPWHTQRDNMTELAGWLSMVSGSLANMAQDVILLAQSEVGEITEIADPSRGGSSTMPQKNNPVTSELIIAAARANASLLSSMHDALIHEHERGTHALQLEWFNLPQMFALTGSALKKAIDLSQNLVVHGSQMDRNVNASNGLMLAEAVSFALSSIMSRAEAQRIVKECCQVSKVQGRHLVDVVREKTDAPFEWSHLKEESAYFGSAGIFIDRVIQAAKKAIDS